MKRTVRVNNGHFEVMTGETKGGNARPDWVYIDWVPHKGEVNASLNPIDAQRLANAIEEVRDDALARAISEILVESGYADEGFRLC